MIRNVVFDFGQVLVRFEPEKMTEKYIDNKEDLGLVYPVLFDRLYWDRLDAGTISDEETLRLVCERLPERLHETARKIYYNWIYLIPEIDGMEDVIKKLKSKGIHIFVLSNISRYFAEHSDEIPILRHAEKCIFSAVCGYTKPSFEIFEHLCETCGIDKAETVFVDDSEKNIKGAQNYGICGYLFDGDVKKLEDYLCRKGIL